MCVDRVAYHFCGVDGLATAHAHDHVAAVRLGHFGQSLDFLRRGLASKPLDGHAEELLPGREIGGKDLFLGRVAGNEQRFRAETLDFFGKTF